MTVPLRGPADLTLQPMNLTLDYIGTGNITVSWGEVGYDYSQGIIIGYKIFCYDQQTGASLQNQTIDSGDTHATLFEALPYYTDLLFDILAFTIKGDGPLSKGKDNMMPIRTKGNCMYIFCFLLFVNYLFFLISIN